MNPLIGVAISLVPELLKLIAGEKAGTIGQDVVDVVTKVTNTSSPEEATKKIIDDPKIKADLQAQLAQIALAAQQAQFADAQNQREADNKADEIANVSTTGARQALLDFAKTAPLLAWTPAVLSYIVVGGFLILLGMMSLGWVSPDAVGSDKVLQIFNILIGALAAAFATVMNFWLGSSLGSRGKDRLIEYQATQAQQRGDDGTPGATAPDVPGGSSGQAADDGVAGSPNEGALATGDERKDLTSGSRKPDIKPQDPVTATRPGAVREALPELTSLHGHFSEGVRWQLAPEGIGVESAKPAGTMGEPALVRKIWNDFGPLCGTYAKKYGVPVELIVATIATESGGKPDAGRPEPTLNDQSVGLMQTLTKTASNALRRPVSGHDLLDPATAINAGTAYIAQQRSSTHFDPPLVAAAYNAGSIRLDRDDRNRWKLFCFPPGTGHHVDKFVAFFSDCMKVSAEGSWSAGDVPSFAADLSGAAPASSTGPTEPSETVAAGSLGDRGLVRFGPDFPPHPAFQALTDADREAIFGKYAFAPDPTSGDPQQIRITDGWDLENIVNVVIPFVDASRVRKLFPGAGPVEMRFHKKAKDQLVALWLEWEKAGLLDRVLAFDGAFVPRFKRPNPHTSAPSAFPKLSNHAFGTAFDINARFNPRGEQPALVGQTGTVRELVQIANTFGFFWGGHFHPPLDGMHFEIAHLQGNPALTS